MLQIVTAELQGDDPSPQSPQAPPWLQLSMAMAMIQNLAMKNFARNARNARHLIWIQIFYSP
jgi:hypothetical protein